MESQHRLMFDDARTLDSIDSCELVVTSPPYPMIEMWDPTFTAIDPTIDDALASGDGQRAFDAMHAILDAVWNELASVVVPGGIVCINVGDATRSLHESFRAYHNHARIIDGMEAAGFETLPDILWRKPANSAAKFMGSGMVPPNAYVTLEHEYILIFRKGSARRTFPPKDSARYEAAYFWEERNTWFSDLWTDVRGIDQELVGDESRERTGAYPLEIPYRLLSMFSIYGDTVLDPFAGTGTTTLAAMMTGRNSISIEIDRDLENTIRQRLADAPRLANRWNRERLDDHQEFVEAQQETGTSFDYTATCYDVPVRTAQEEQIQFYAIDDMTETPDGYQLTHHPFVPKR